VARDPEHRVASRHATVALMTTPVEAELARLRSLIEHSHGWLHNHSAAIHDLDEEDRVEGHFNTGDDTDENGDAGMIFVETYRNVISVPRAFQKARKRPRSLMEVDTVVIHQTAVGGGFAVSKRMLEHHGDEFQARQIRYRDTPYHGMFSPRDRASIIQWPAWVHTFHGHKSNTTSVGWAYDGMVPGDELDLAGARAALRHFVIAMREAGVPLRYVEAHRQHAAERALDPGVEIWTQIVRPLLADVGLEERSARTTGSGLALPAEWLAGT
jgi:hypothetical protein